jgi:hypothetical protein
MATKQLSRVELKADGPDRGQVSAVFATFNVIDLDGDVTLPGAFTDGAEVPISSYGHGSWQTGVPVGKGKIRTTDTEAILDGQFFMDTQSGKDTFTAVKALGGLGQWSYGYDVLDAAPGVQNGVDVRLLKALLMHEVSPVLVGVGVNTRTVSAKGAKTGQPGASFVTGIKAHTSAWTSREWDPKAVVAGIASGASVSELRSVFALVDAAGDPETKSSYQFPHHHGVDGPTNVRALVTAISSLNGELGATMPEAARKAAYEHLASHLRDADREPPELRSVGIAQKNIDRLPGLLGELATLVDDLREVGSSRAAKGKRLSSLTFEALGWAEKDLTAVLTNVRALTKSQHEAAELEFIRYLASQRQGRQSA